jgi:hypothetical protein
VTSSASYFTSVVASLTIGGITGLFEVVTKALPAPDVTPDAFSFTAVTDATRSTQYTSGSITVAGITAGVEVAVTVDGGTYAKNAGSYTSLPGVAVLGDTFTVRLTSSGAYQTAASARLTIGGVSALFSVTTEDAPVAPPTDEILVGFKTRCGYGGYAMNLPPGSTITGTDADKVSINAYGELVPAGVYGAAMNWGTWAAGQSRSLTFADGTTRTVTLVANTAHVRGDPRDTQSSNQLTTAIRLAARGDDIIGRDSHFNPNGLGGASLWRQSAPTATGWAGSGTITVKSENPDTSTDANGNLVRGGGFKIGAITMNASSDLEFPITFEDVTFYSNYNVAGRAIFLGYSSVTVGWGVNATRCRFETGPDVDAVNWENGFNNQGGAAVDCYFKRCEAGVNSGRSVGDVQTKVSGCVFEAIQTDAVHLTGENFLVEDNFGFNWEVPTGAHADGFQHGGAKVRNIAALGTWRRNIWVLNSASSGPQGDFFGDTVQPYRVAGCTVENEIIITGAANAVSMTYYDGALVRNCTVLKPIGSAVVGATDATIRMVSCGTSTVDSCVANAYALGGMTSTDNVTIDDTMSAYQTAMPGYVGGTDPGFTSRAAVIAAVKPANLAVASGGFKKLDGTYAGALDNTGAYVT